MSIQVIIAGQNVFPYLAGVFLAGLGTGFGIGILISRRNMKKKEKTK